MDRIKNYTIIDKLAETRGSVVYRGSIDNENRTVIIKAMKTTMPTPSEVARFRQEFEIIKKICLDGVIKTYDLIEENGNFYFILEDFNGVSIKTLLNSNRRFNRKSFLKIAIKIAEILGNLHVNNIIHRDIKPHNILINIQSGSLKITDFGISTVITHENDEIYNPDFITGTLSYMSPEQTGRINRSVDYRTDLYSFGISLYEIVTGTTPFTSRDPMELIHSHIAVMPPPPAEIKQGIPGAVSDIIMKLLEKTPEERYQNAFGAMHDLMICLKQLEETETIERFKLGSADISNRFIIPEQLFGRNREIARLLENFDAATRQDSGASVMVVTGAPGIGKSALINEIHKPIVAKRGYFISGKYELFRKDKPYNGIIQAFQKLVSQILSESEEMISVWRNDLNRALQNNGKIITDVIPDVEFIIGKQPEPASLGPEETKNRFNFLFEKFTNLFPSENHPVVLFLDDLQWADTASLQLLKNIITNPDIKNFFLILSFRDTEVNNFHPVMEFLKEIERNNIPVSNIFLGPIHESDIKQLIMNFLKCSPAKGEELASIIFKKTGGNPFFVNQFLHVLHNEKKIVSAGRPGWRWDIDEIANMQITDNLVEMMSGKINRLSSETREVLKICACIGNRFDLETLSRVRDSSIDKALFDLNEAIEEGLVNSYGDMYIFHHDRIHEAAYSIATENEKKRLHYLIGRISLGSMGNMESSGKLFYIADQLNLGADIAGDSDRMELAQINLEVGKRAKQSAAYSPAYSYLEHGIRYLNADSWGSQYELTLSLYTHLTETAYLMGNFQRMNELADTVIRRAKSTLDKTEIYITKIHALIAQEEFHSAIDTAVPILKQLGVRFRKNASSLQVVLEFIRTMKLLKGKNQNYFLNLPAMTDPEMLAAARIITSMSHAAFYVDPNMLGISIFKTFAIIDKYGHSPDHIVAYFGLAFILAAESYDFKRADELSEIGKKLMSMFDSRRLESQAIFTYNALYRHWTGDIKDTITQMHEGFRIGMETGVLGFAGFNLFFADIHSMYSTFKASEVSEMMASTNKKINGLNQKHLLTQQSLSWQSLLNLIGECDDPFRLKGRAIDAESQVEVWENKKNSGALATYWFSKILAGIFYNNFDFAYHSLNNFQRYRNSLKNIIINRYLLLHDSIIKIMMYHSFSDLKKISVKRGIKSNLEILNKISKFAPDNVLYMIIIIEGLYDWRINGDYKSAVRKIEESIKICRNNRDLLHEGLFNEFAVKLYLETGNESRAARHLASSYTAFMKWGSPGIVNRLVKNYPDMIQPVSSSDDPGQATDSSTLNTDTGTKSLDISTVLKATQAISGEIVLDRLLERMLKIVMENAGAEKGFMILEERGTLLVEAEGATGRTISVMKSIPVEIHSGLSSAIVNFAARKKGTIILNDATAEGDFISDPYVLQNKPKSILCSAVLNQGKISCIIYLENNLSSGAFTPQRLEILNILSSQIAISIENARLYETMEDRVRERTEDLYAANNELEQINNMLSETNRQLKQAQHIAERDMAMATRIQASFFPAEAPKNREWDISFVFKALSGVSGDLYDFYETEGKLNGVLIMDVSGHGIASGLITTIARSVFERNFMHWIEYPLSEVVKRANSEMIGEIGNVDNYLTGILLRISGNRIEYINAAHPEFCIKSGKTGEAMSAHDLGYTVKGDIIGVAELEKEYQVCTFNIETDDTILLFTDCIYESKNPEGEEFGLQRLIKSFSDAPAGSSKSILDHILYDLYEFTGTERLSDDLTVIVLKKNP